MWFRSVSASCLVLFALACSESADPQGQGGTGGTSGGGTGGTGLSGTGSGTGASGGATGTAGGGGTGVGGDSSCTPVTLGALQLTDTGAGESSLAYALEGLAAGQEHILFLEFFDQGSAQAAGSFDVAVPPDDNYSTCTHCVLVFEDFNAASPTAYYPDMGSIDVTEPDVSYSAESSGSLTALRLVEVTLDQTVTTPVLDGACLTLANGPWDTTP